jgi:hypothetical protein
MVLFEHSFNWLPSGKSKLAVPPVSGSNTKMLFLMTKRGAFLESLKNGPAP